MVDENSNNYYANSVRIANQLDTEYNGTVAEIGGPNGSATAYIRFEGITQPPTRIDTLTMKWRTKDSEDFDIQMERIPVKRQQ